MVGRYIMIEMPQSAILLVISSAIMLPVSIVMVERYIIEVQSGILPAILSAIMFLGAAVIFMVGRYIMIEMPQSAILPAILSAIMLKPI